MFSPRAKQNRRTGRCRCLPSAHSTIVVNNARLLDGAEPRELPLQIFGCDAKEEVANVDRPFGRWSRPPELVLSLSGNATTWSVCRPYGAGLGIISIRSVSILLRRELAVTITGATTRRVFAKAPSLERNIGGLGSQIDCRIGSGQGPNR